MGTLANFDFSKSDISKADYKQRRDALVDELVLAQQRAIGAGRGVVVLFEGWAGAGKGTRISDIVYNLDARATDVYVLPDVNLDEVAHFKKLASGTTGFHPLMQEFWSALGRRGHITFFDRGWYAKSVEQALALRLAGAKKRDAINCAQAAMRSVEDFERALVADGYKVVKFFVHISHKAQLERLEKLRDNPATSWRAPKAKFRLAAHYDEELALYDRMLARTNFEFAPWTVLNGQDKRATTLAILKTLIAALNGEGGEGEGERQDAALDGQPDEASRACTDALRDSGATALLQNDTSRAGTVDEANPVDARIAGDAGFEIAGGIGDAACAAGTVDEANPAGTAGAGDAGSAGTAGAGEAGPADAAGVGEAGSAGLSGAAAPAVAPAAAASDAVAADAHLHLPRDGRFQVASPVLRVEDFRHDLSLDEDTYRMQLKACQKRLFELESRMYKARVPMLVMYEGWDAAGKGGNIKRVAQALDARAYKIYPSPAPTPDELAHPHLWRYWTRLPKAGHVGIYDRSWYGRVLVERVEGFTPEARWREGYDEICAFEQDLVAWGAILIKFWVDISPDTQLERFNARAADPQKQWKITDEDWRNREKYPQYAAAVNEMFARTNTPYAPWHILESDDKRYARIKALQTIIEALEDRLG